MVLYYRNNIQGIISSTWKYFTLVARLADTGDIVAQSSTFVSIVT